MTDPLDTLEDDYETELSRLGSSKAIYALTGGEMETDAVLAHLAGRAAAAAATFEDWRDDEEFGDLFEDAAVAARGFADRIEETAGAAEPADAPAETALRDLQDPDARLGGLVAWALVTDQTLSQVVGFFVGNADPQAADLFRDLRSDLDQLRGSTLERVEAADGETAGGAASTVIEAAYAGYVETLEGLGVKVKPVC